MSANGPRPHSDLPGAPAGLQEGVAVLAAPPLATSLLFAHAATDQYA